MNDLITKCRNEIATFGRISAANAQKLVDSLAAAHAELQRLQSSQGRSGVNKNMMPAITLEWCDEIWRNVPAELRKSIPECVQWIIQQDRARFVESRNRPWSNFLEARADAIDWLYADGNTDIQIAKLLSIDRVQVTLIRIRDRSMPGVVVLRMPHDEEWPAPAVQGKTAKTPKGKRAQK